jgi:transcriptional regulator with XRE-family HTH domain
MVPQEVMREFARRARELRLGQNITQKELAERVGVAEGTIKRFEHTGEIQFRTLLGIALVLGRLDDFADVFKISDVPKSLYHPEPKKPRQRARKK